VERMASSGPWRQVEFLAQLPDALRAEIAQRLNTVRSPQGRTLLEKGSTCRDVFFILEGEVEVVLYSPDGREVFVTTLGCGEMFGQLAALDGGPRSATILALSDVVTAVMSPTDFMRCIENSPASAVWLARNLASALRRATEHIFELSALNVRTRLHNELLRLAKEGKRGVSGIDVRPSPTHSEIANRIGTNREAVTREMRALSEMKIILYDRRSLTILDATRLERLTLR
jgi:CRP/FNR family cyclic AMP-dependent transcriptional regulator